MPAHDDRPLRGLPARVRRSRRMAVAARRAGLAPSVPRHGSDPRADEALTTLDATIRPLGGGAAYRRLDWAPGEPHVLRDDLGVRPAADRTATRTSLLYVAHHTDVHICDAQSPSRLEGGDAFGWANPGSDGGHRPQEIFTTQVLDQLVVATNAVTTSPLSGAPMAWCVQTGDNVDNRGAAELRWWIDVLDGREVTPNSGAPDRYEGVQRSGWRGAWHPDRAGWDRRSRAGFPHLPGVLDAGVAAFAPVGLAVPWLAVFGNHDLIFQGSFGPTRGARLDLLGAMLVDTDRKPIGAAGLARALAVATATKGDPARWARTARGPWVQEVTPDPDARRPVAADDYVATLLDPGPDGARGPGPLGHGFTEANVLDGTTWWSRWEGPHLQVIGLDTCNHTHGDGGGMGPAQTAWLTDQLERCHTRYRDERGRWVDGHGPDRMVILLSHHASWTMANTVDDEADPGPRTLGPALLDLLDRFPNVVLWINGHTHRHTVQAHRRTEGGGWWELNTASGIDFGQQGRTIELFANGDGTLSIVATVLDHHGPPRVAHRRDGRWAPVELASLSRELAANDDQWVDPLYGLGRVEDRNVELALPLPFPLD
ncbi:MAG TPA: TIGR03767 family metallophosphoesterase [Iamia sp.]|nr:TIGR03767 family metallophosphoesterase [Iamia sp.]